MNAQFVKIHEFVKDRNHGVHDLSVDQLKLILTNEPINPATHFQVSALNEIAAGNGYPAGGFPVTVTSSDQVAGVYSLSIADLVISAVGGSIAQFQYAYLYNDDSPNDRVIFAYQADSSIDLTDGDSATFDFPDSVFEDQ